MTESQTIRNRAEKLLPLMTSLRRKIHACPEIGLSNPLTQSAILDALSNCAGEIRAGKGETSWVSYALTGNRPGRNVLFRADTDALPIIENPATGNDYISTNYGLMHACGHDMHTSMLVGTAHLLDQLSGEWEGSITMLFQPGEEGYFGAEHCIADGAIDISQFDEAFAMHVDPQLESGNIALKSGAILAGSDTFSIKVHGIGGHASEPHLGRDPITIGCEIVLALQVMATRTVDPFNPAVITVAKIDGGTTRNVLPASVNLLGTIRSFSLTSRIALRDSVKKVADGICHAHNASCDVVFTPGYSPTINDPKLTDFAYHQSVKLLGSSSVVLLDSPRMGSEDFSTYLEYLPGVMVMLGCKKVQSSYESAKPLHSDQFDPDETSMATGAAYFAALVTSSSDNG